MKALLVIALMLACGIEPMEPLSMMGCRHAKAVCVCDSDQNCNWVWICEE